MNGGFLSVVVALVVAAALLVGLADASDKRSASRRRTTTSRRGDASVAYEQVLAALERSVKLRYSLNEKTESSIKELLAEYNKSKPPPVRKYPYRNEDDETNSVLWKGVNRALLYRNVVAFACKKCNNKNAKLCNSSSNKPLVHELEAVQFADFVSANPANEAVMNKFFKNWISWTISKSGGMEDTHFYDLYADMKQMPSLERYYVHAFKTLAPLAEEFPFINGFTAIAQRAVQVQYHDAIKSLLDNGNESILKLWFDRRTLNKLYGYIPDYIKREATADDKHLVLVAVNVLDVIYEFITDNSLKSEFDANRRDRDKRQEVEALLVAYKSASDWGMWKGYNEELRRLHKRKMLALLNNSNYPDFVYTDEDWFNGQRDRHGDLVERPPPEVFMTHLYTIVRRSKYCNTFPFARKYCVQVQELIADGAAYAAADLLKAPPLRWTSPEARTFALIHKYLRYQQECKNPNVFGVSADVRRYACAKLKPEDGDKKKALELVLSGN